MSNIISNFSPEGKKAIRKILKSLKVADTAFRSLNDVENRECFEMHGAGSSLNHCIRWGLSAAEEISTAINQPKSNPKKAA